VSFLDRSPEVSICHQLLSVDFWKTAAKKPVKNDDLWKELDSLVQQHEVRWTWVKGHAGHPENEKADELANRGAAKFL